MSNLTYNTKRGILLIAIFMLYGIIAFKVCAFEPVSSSSDMQAIFPLDSAPVIYNENKSVNEDIILTVLAGSGIISNGDYDPEGSALTVNTTPLVNPAHGGVVVQSNGAFTYTPSSNFNGSDYFVVDVCDNTPLCTADTIFITINPVNDPIILANESTFTNEGVAIGGTILFAGDYDIDSTNIKVDIIPVSGPNHGWFFIDTTGLYVYVADAYFHGLDTIVTNVCDRGNPLPITCGNDTLFITVNPINDNPTIISEYVNAYENTPLNGTVIDSSDFDPDSVGFWADTVPVYGPFNGTFIIIPNGSYTYTPDSGYCGFDTIVVSVCDSGYPLPSLCDYDTLFITINRVNKPIVLVNENNSTNEDTPVNGTIISAGDYDPDTTAITVNTTPVSGPFHGMIVIDNAGNYTYTPNQDFSGSDIAVFNICDAGTPMPATCMNDTLFISVNPINDTLIVVNDTISTNERTSISGTILTSSDYDPDTTALIVNTVPIFGPNNGIIVVNANGSYTYSPDSLFNGIDTAVLVVCDNGNPLPVTCANDTLFIVVNMVNNAPVIANDLIIVNEDASVNGTVINGSDADPDGTFLTADTIPLSGPNHGTISVNMNGSYTYIPDPNYNGIDTVVITICDAGLPLPAICVNDTLFITVIPLNDIPSVNNENISVCSGSSVQASVLINDSDIDLDTLAISSLIQPADGSASINGTTIIYTPDPGFIGSDSIIYVVCDNGSPQLCVQGILYINVNGISGTSITSSEVLCTGDSSGSVMTSPSGNAPFSFIWSNGAASQNIINVPAGIYIVTITDFMGCSIQDSAVISEPNAAIAVSGSITDVKCFGDSTGSITLAVSGGTAPYNYLWTNGDTSKDLLNVPASFYSATITDSHGCTQTVSQPVTQPSAAISISGVSTPANCLGGIQGAIDVTVNGGTPGYTYNWSSGSAAQDISSMPGAYTIIVTDSNSCIDSASYTISDNSTLTINSSGAVSFCSGDSTVLNSSAFGGTFQWLQNGIAIQGASDSIFSVSQSGIFSLTQNNSCGSFTSNNIVVSVNPIPVLSISGILVICENLSTQLFAAGANSYSWAPSLSLNNDTLDSPEASPLVTTTYTVTGTSLGCISDTTVTVTVNPPPNISVFASLHDCKNGAQLNASGAVGYIWQPAIGLNTINIPNPIADPEFTTTYTVTAFNSNQCSSTDSVTIIIDCAKVTVPSGFSPNNDGINDRFVIAGIENYPVNSLQVFNRWGNMIYSKDNYDNSWDGTQNINESNINGKITNGTYYYILNLGEAEKSKSGFIVVKY